MKKKKKEKKLKEKKKNEFTKANIFKGTIARECFSHPNISKSFTVRELNFPSKYF